MDVMSIWEKRDFWSASITYGTACSRRRQMRYLFDQEVFASAVAWVAFKWCSSWHPVQKIMGFLVGMYLEFDFL